jgi:hypothetical protein
MTSVVLQLSDWVPVSCVALKWLGGSVANNPLLQGVADHRLAMPAAVRELRREIWECACQVFFLMHARARTHAYHTHMLTNTPRRAYEAS